MNIFGKNIESEKNSYKNWDGSGDNNQVFTL